MRSGDAEKVHRHLTSQALVLFIQGVLAKSDFLRAIQPFDVDFIADDWVFNIKVFQSLLTYGGKFNFERSICFIRNIHSENTSRNLVLHYERVRQVAERHYANAKLIKSSFITNGIFSAIGKRYRTTFLIFMRKALSYPEAFVTFARSIVAIGIRKLRQ
jgi:hypothetical protein